MVMLGGGADILRGVVVLPDSDGAWSWLAKWVKQRAAQVLEQMEAIRVLAEQLCRLGARLMPDGYVVEFRFNV
jgi:hypothetical protein